jgi:hypothetical protein
MGFLFAGERFHGTSAVVQSDRRLFRENAGAFFYLRTPDARTVGTGTGIGEKAGLLGGVAAGPVFLHVGTTFVEPTVVGYEPTEGCTTDPYPSVPVVCASASVLVRVNAVASAIVVTFMVVSFALDKETTRRPLGLSVQFFFSNAGNYITKLPKAEHEAPEWQAAMQALILVATRGGPTMLARIGVMRALNRHVERVFDGDRKNPHWGRRKLKRDMT